MTPSTLRICNISEEGRRYGSPLVTFSGPLPGVILTWQLDGLSAFFALVVLAISAVTGLYAAGHARHEASFRASGLIYVLFILAMLAVAVAGDAFTFLLAWETMSLASFALTKHRHDTVRGAVWAYLVMTHGFAPATSRNNDEGPANQTPRLAP